MEPTTHVLVQTAIAGPEYFGFNQPEVVEAVEALDPQHLCTEYW